MPQKPSQRQSFFSHLANDVAKMVGSPVTFTVALFLVIVWGLCGPVFGYSNTWQLLINTATTIVTFLLVILLQHTQNHDAKAVHLKLDELIRSVKSARNSLVDLEAMTDEELDALHEEFRAIRERSLKRRGGKRPVD